jgi:hypothetical protein
MADIRSLSRLPEETYESFKLRLRFLNQAYKQYKKGANFTFEEHLEYERRVKEAKNNKSND